MTTDTTVEHDIEGTGARRMAPPVPSDVPGSVAPAEPDAPARSRIGRRMARRVLLFVAKLVGGLLSVAVTAMIIVPSFLPYDVFYVRTGSMRPGMPVGSLLISHRVPAASLHVGDVITFARPVTDGGLVTHRIVEIQEGPHGRSFRTRGDANPEPDPWIVDGRGAGWKRVAHVSKLGYVVGTLRDALRHRVVLFGVTALLGLVTLVDIWRQPTVEPHRH